MRLALAPVFGSGMVLQRDRPAPVWGTAPAGAAVTVSLGSLTAAAEAGPDGRWEVKLPPAPAGGPYRLTVCCGGEVLCREEVYRGEVWLAGGQSNMEMPLARSENGAEAVRSSENPRFHVCVVPRAARKPPEDLRWTAVSPATAGELSAVAYYAGRVLTEHLPVHVGVIVCCWGATYARCWTDRAALLEFPAGAKQVRDYDALIGDKPEEVFEREEAAYQRELDAWNLRPEGPYPWPPPAGKTSFHYPGNLYRTMLRPLAPYGIRGVWYYQGEQDEIWPENYFSLLTALIRCWRRAWRDDGLPFLLAQLPMYISREDSRRGDPMAWPVLRRAQADAARTLSGVELAVLADCGEFDNVHPLDKRTPGTRLGLLALEAVYGLPLTGRPPVCAEAWREGAAVLVRFAHAGGGLRLTGPGFQLAGENGVFVPADARTVSADTVRVTAPGVLRPTAVRYAWYSFGPAGLWGGTGLAAAPLAIEFEK